ncbi:hypothetical protein GPECTOR_16g720 [Gonium pectorale]|uniref:Uncharacterized protein n=1 Tax=Gonium pectorale TaxID=33097 RepID=A0A150GLD2_GONPE|nr:hypothetical protein GPECTOR_16g720 [Gonium pectorale]|eukprot:KXZ50545.1 hypothetical protein GPECTOR_16g720 [Gonium pectorale]
MELDTRRSGRVFPQLPDELTELIARRLHPNEIAVTRRMVNKAAAAQFRGPHRARVRLSQPVPSHAFAAHWLAPAATRRLTLPRKGDLLRLTAASGVVANLEVAVRAVGWEPTLEAFQVHDAAALVIAGRKGHWLIQRGCPVHTHLPRCSILYAAASAGHPHVCEWLLERAPGWAADDAAGAAACLAAAAASGGRPRPAAAAQLLKLGTDSGAAQRDIIRHSARHSDLAALRRRIQAGGWGQPEEVSRGKALLMAASSPTPDWAAKVEWLEAQGCRRSGKVIRWCAYLSKGDQETLARVVWLRGRGYPFDAVEIATAAAYSGKTATLQYLLAEAPEAALKAVCIAAWGGQLAALQALYGGGGGGGVEVDGHRAALCAAMGGHLHVLAWLVEALGAEAVRLDEELFAAGAGSGSVELLTWLAERGCPRKPDALALAAGAGCEAAAEWLVERGCCGAPKRNAAAPDVLLAGRRVFAAATSSACTSAPCAA